MRILYITTIGSTMVFFKNLIKELIDDGNIVDIATNEEDVEVPECYREWGCRVYPISTSRSPLSAGNIKAIYQIRELAKNYDVVHCHTPIAGMATRLGCRPLRNFGVKVIYTAHGFHFFKGAPIKNWIIYYPIEKICSRWTDVLITINKEDFNLAQNRFKARRVEYVPGVGVDIDKFKDAVVDKATKRRELGIPEDAFLLLSIGELNENKNHRIVLDALEKIHKPEMHYCIAGVGELQSEFINKAREKNLENQVHFLGWRNDVEELYKIAEINVFPSIREGLGLAGIEGMAAGVPLICSDNRGTRSYAADKENAIVCKYDDVEAFKDAILFLYSNRQIAEEYVLAGQLTADRFSTRVVNPMILDIYEDCYSVE